MYNTPNNCNTLEQIDRDIRRVEDKADTNAATIAVNYKEQGERIGQNSERITRNEANIACLGKRLEDAKACAIDAYCNGEIDCKLAAKADRCAFEKHLINPHAHEELFDRKVDKQDGFGLISDDCLAQICQNKDGLVLLEQYIRELQEQNACLKEELANKVNGSWNFYSSLSEFGLSRGQETIEKIVEAMAYPATASIYVNVEAGSADIYPRRAGYLSVNKHSDIRASVKFLNRDGLLEWNGDYYGDRTPKWKGWIQLGIAVHDSYELPIATSNVAKNGACQYVVDSIGGVEINLDVKPVSGGTDIIGNGMLVATMPAGSRPSESVKCVGGVSTSEGISVGYFSVETNGHIRVYHGESRATTAFGSIRYYV